MRFLSKMRGFCALAVVFSFFNTVYINYLPAETVKTDIQALEKEAELRRKHSLEVMKAKMEASRLKFMQQIKAQGITMRREQQIMLKKIENEADERNKKFKKIIAQRTEAREERVKKRDASLKKRFSAGKKGLFASIFRFIGNVLHTIFSPVYNFVRRIL